MRRQTLTTKYSLFWTRVDSRLITDCLVVFEMSPTTKLSCHPPLLKPYDTLLMSVDEGRCGLLWAAVDRCGPMESVAFILAIEQVYVLLVATILETMRATKMEI